MMARTKEAAGNVEAFLRTNPGPMSSTVGPQQVFKDAHKLYAATCSEPVDLGEFTDHLWARGLTLEVVGNRYWLKLPGKNKAHLQIVDSPTRIA